MQIVYGINKIKNIKGSVVTIGVFDGVHIGHQRIIKSLVKKAKEENLKSIIVTFYPHPQKENLVLTLDERLDMFKILNLDFCIVIRADKDFLATDPVNFIREFLVNRLKTKYLFVGENFRFGKNRRGDIKLLKEFAYRFGFKLKVFRLVKKNGCIVSSTKLRKLILKSELTKLSEFLRRNFEFKGKVKKGSGLGKILGFPTANLDYPTNKIFLPAGVYLGKVILERKEWKALIYIGTKPTFTRKNKLKIEVHILGSHKNLYGKEIKIQFIKKIREEQKFNTPEDLKNQVKKDIEKAISFFLK